MLFDFLGLYPYYGHKILTWVGRAPEKLDPNTRTHKPSSCDCLRQKNMLGLRAFLIVGGGSFIHSFIHSFIYSYLRPTYIHRYIHI